MVIEVVWLLGLIVAVMARLLGGRARDGYVVKGQEIKLWSCIHLAYGIIAYVADTQYFVHHGV